MPSHYHNLTKNTNLPNQTNKIRKKQAISIDPQNLLLFSFEIQLKSERNRNKKKQKLVYKFNSNPIHSQLTFGHTLKWRQFSQVIYKKQKNIRK